MGTFNGIRSRIKIKVNGIIEEEKRRIRNRKEKRGRNKRII